MEKSAIFPIFLSYWRIMRKYILNSALQSTLYLDKQNAFLILILVYIVNNDSFHIIATDGLETTAYLFKLKNLLVFYLNDDTKYSSGATNFKLLKTFRKLNLI